MTDSISPKKRNGIAAIAVLVGLFGGAAGHNIVVSFGKPAEAQFIQDCKDVQTEQNEKLEVIRNEQNQLKTSVVVLQGKVETQNKLLEKIQEKLDKPRWKR